jgi:hypothetical protein
VDVTSAGQLQVAPANPASLFQNQYTVNSGDDTLSTVAQPPTGDALVVEDVHMAVEVLSNGDVPMYLAVRTGATCSTGSVVPGLNQPLYASDLGDMDDPLSPYQVATRSAFRSTARKTMSSLPQPPRAIPFRPATLHRKEDRSGRPTVPDQGGRGTNRSTDPAPSPRPT